MKKSDKPKASKAGRKIRKPHFPGQQLNKIARDVRVNTQKIVHRSRWQAGGHAIDGATTLGRRVGVLLHFLHSFLQCTQEFLRLANVTNSDTSAQKSDAATD
ncbi:hypothetical protein GQ600_7588 [Phytophthora cactorum]|nr:hypothetical protein GQ600_7588 [Phytophthora cactorum]